MSEAKETPTQTRPHPGKTALAAEQIAAEVAVATDPEPGDRCGTEDPNNPRRRRGQPE